MPTDKHGPPDASAARFESTRWSIVVAAGAGAGDEARQALAILCQSYWYPVYAFLRRVGRSAEEAGDLTQGFFAHLLDKEILATADPRRGRFRSFLLKSVQNFAANQDEQARAQKRGGAARTISLELEDAESRYRLEPAHAVTPERLFERRWALALLDCVLTRLRRQATDGSGKKVFDRLKVFLGGPLPDDSYAAAGAELDMTEAAIKVAIHRMRKRYRDLLEEEIARTVESDQEIQDEISHLFAALADRNA